MKKFLILITLWCSVLTANASLISIDVEDKLYQVGDVLTANIYLSELKIGPQELVSEYAFDLMSLDSLLTFQGISFGSKLNVGFIPSDQVFNNALLNGLRVSEFSFGDIFDLGDAQDGFTSFLLASVNFTVKNIGFAALSLENVGVFDENANSHRSLSTKGANVQLGNQVSVPEPSTIAIFSLAIMFLLGSSKLRKS